MGGASAAGGLCELCVLLPQVYSSLSEGDLQLLRQTLLVFLQDMNIRVSSARAARAEVLGRRSPVASLQVSLFLKSGVQNPNGRFAMAPSGPVPQGTDVPGLIR